MHESLREEANLEAALFSERIIVSIIFLRMKICDAPVTTGLRLRFRNRRRASQASRIDGKEQRDRGQTGTRADADQRRSCQGSSTEPESHSID
jgi:hypothetical protein